MVSEDEFQEAFSLFDRDGVGSVTYVDVGKTVRSLGFNPTEAELKEWIAQVDPSDSGAIDYSQFVALMAKVKSKPQSSDQEVRDAFQVLDKKKTGVISVTELRHLLTTVGEPLTNEEVDELLSNISANGDNVDYTDFVKLLTAR